LAVSILGCTYPGYAQPPSPPSGSAAPALTATVRSVDAQARTLEVVTGVGHALRVVKFAFDERTEVKSAAGTASLAQLKPGDLIRVGYTKDAGVNTAKTIEVLPRPDARGAR
jgi:methenyltetrahydromethanopterin cyclohydrolase